MELLYKLAAVEDLDVLTTTRIEVLRAANKLDESEDMSQVKNESYEYYQRALTDKSHIAILVFDGDEFVGTGGVSFYTVMPTYHNPSGRKAYIMNMYTKPEYRRNGIAYRTLDLLIQETKKLGIHHITLEATDMGQLLYEKYGFIKMENQMELPNDI